VLSSLILATAFQIGPFYQQNDDFTALRPFWSQQGETTDVLWPLFTSHRDWWRFLFFVHNQENQEGSQFEIMPLWFNGNGRTLEGKDESYWGLFPFYGHHPHIILLYDIDFALWPIWHRYRMPIRRGTDDQTFLTSNSVLFPFFHWRSDGSFGIWPFYGNSYNRSDYSQYVLWPFFTWKESVADRDTAGAGFSWMFWPFYASIDCEREQQWMVLPPFFSHARVPDGYRTRVLTPIVEIEERAKRSRLSVFPFYEHIANRRYFDGAKIDEIRRYGWRLVEDLPDEFRVFPFWVSRPDHTYFRLWPFYEEVQVAEETSVGRVFPLIPIRWIDGVDRNWSKFWTFYICEKHVGYTDHSLFWGLIRWTTSYL